MATVTKPIALDETLQATNAQLETTDATPVNIADVLKNGLAGVASAISPNASDIPYDNTTSGLTADDVQEAIDELATEKADSATTLNGYGITNAYTKAETDAEIDAEIANIGTFSASGTSFALTPTSEGNVLAHSIYGMSVQDGTPTPSSPVDIESAVANFKCVGKNLIPYPYYTSAGTLQDVTITIDSDYGISLNGTASGRGYFAYRSRLESNATIKKPGNYTAIIEIKGGTYTLSSNDQFVGRLYATTASSPYKEIFRLGLSSLNVGVYTTTFSVTQEDLDTYPVQGFWYELQSGNVYNKLEVNATIQLAEVTDATYESYQSTDVTTDLTLRAIEVTSSDDYTYEKDGKYYIADTVDWSEDDGYVLTRRIAHREFDGTETGWAKSSATAADTFQISDNEAYQSAASTGSYLVKCLQSNRFVPDRNAGDMSVGECRVENSFLRFAYTAYNTTSLTDWKTYLGSNPLIIDFIKVTPTITPLTAQQAEELMKLKTYDVSTTINSTSEVAPIVDLEYAKHRIAGIALTGHNDSFNRVGWDAENVMGAKNLLPYPYYNTTMTKNGITITDNGDGTITVNGTATANVPVVLNNQLSDDIEAGTDLILTGCPSGGSSNTYKISVDTYTTSFALIANDYGQGAQFTLPSDVLRVRVFFVIYSGTTVTNLTFKPMLRLASIQDSTYAPYAKTNKELTDNIADTNERIDLESNTFTATGESFALTDTSEGNVLAHSIYGMSVQDGTPAPSSPVDIESAVANYQCVGKNLIPYPYYETTKTENGVTFIDNGDGTITVSTVNAGASADATFTIRNIWSASNLVELLPNTIYAFSGCPVGGSTSTYSIQFVNEESDLSNKSWYNDSGNGGTITTTDVKRFVGSRIVIYSGTAFSTPVTFKPMLRLASVTDSTYEPYQATTADTDLTLRAIEVTSSDNYNLVKDGKYYIADSVDWSEDDGYVLTRRVENIEFDGSESWYVASGAPSGASLFGLPNFFDANTTRKFLTKSNRFISINSYDDTNRNAPGYVSYAKSNNNIYLGVMDSIASTTSDFQTWLASNTTYVDYVLATPTTSPLTAEQAEALLSLKTYNTSTSITCTADVSPTMEIEYAKERVPALALSGHNVSRINALKIADLNTALIELGGN